VGRKAKNWICRLEGLAVRSANYADESGVCWPSQETLKVGTELSEDTIQRQTKQLVKWSQDKGYTGKSFVSRG
jgi:hypothetical protein